MSKINITLESGQGFPITVKEQTIFQPDEVSAMSGLSVESEFEEVRDGEDLRIEFEGGGVAVLKGFYALDESDRPEVTDSSGAPDAPADAPPTVTVDEGALDPSQIGIKYRDSGDEPVVYQKVTGNIVFTQEQVESLEVLERNDALTIEERAGNDLILHFPNGFTVTLQNYYIASQVPEILEIGEYVPDLAEAPLDNPVEYLEGDDFGVEELDFFSLGDLDVEEVVNDEANVVPLPAIAQPVLLEQIVETKIAPLVPPSGEEDGIASNQPEAQPLGTEPPRDFVNVKPFISLIESETVVNAGKFLLNNYNGRDLAASPDEFEGYDITETVIKEADNSNALFARAFTDGAGAGVGDRDYNTSKQAQATFDSLSVSLVSTDPDFMTSLDVGPFVPIPDGSGGFEDPTAEDFFDGESGDGFLSEGERVDQETERPSGYGELETLVLEGDGGVVMTINLYTEVVTVGGVPVPVGTVPSIVINGQTVLVSLYEVVEDAATSQDTFSPGTRQQDRADLDKLRSLNFTAQAEDNAGNLRFDPSNPSLPVKGDLEQPTVEQLLSSLTYSAGTSNASSDDLGAVNIGGSDVSATRVFQVVLVDNANPAENGTGGGSLTPGKAVSEPVFVNVTAHDAPFLNLMGADDVTTLMAGGAGNSFNLTDTVDVNNSVTFNERTEPANDITAFDPISKVNLSDWSLLPDDEGAVLDRDSEAFRNLTIEIGNLQDGDSEVLTIEGATQGSPASELILTLGTGSSVVASFNSENYTLSLVGSTLTITKTDAPITAAELLSIQDGTLADVDVIALLTGAGFSTNEIEAVLGDRTGTDIAEALGAGILTEEEVESLIAEIQYYNTSNDPGVDPRTFTFTAKDALALDKLDFQQISNEAVATVDVNALNDTPFILGPGESAGDESDGIPGRTETPEVAETVNETDLALSASGAFTIEDQDSDQTVTATRAVSFTPTLDDAEPTMAEILAMFTFTEGAAQVTETEVVSVGATTGTLNWNFNTQDGDFDFLGHDESLELTYTITVTDSSMAGAGDALNEAESVTETVTITVEGTNDTPTISVDAGVGNSAAETLVETDAALTTSGTLSVEDLDTTDTVTPTVTGVAAVGGTGAGTAPPAWALADNADLLAMMEVDAAAVIANSANDGTINWEFESNGEAFDFLGSGETLILSYEITATDNSGAGTPGTAPDEADTNTQTVTITVTGTNDAPSGADNTITTLEDAPHTFAAAEFGFTDVDGDSLSAVRITTLPGTGTLELGGNTVTAGDEILVADIGTLTFTPATNANGAANASFTFQVRDDGGTANGGVDLDQSANTITFDVTSVNDAPAGADNTIATLEGATHTFVAGDFGFTDPADGDSLSAVRITTLPATGTLELNSVAVTAGDEIAVADIGTLTFTPAADANGAANASFTFQVRDDGGTADGGVDLDQSANTITFDVTSVNDAPAGADNTITTLEDTAHTFVAGDFGFTDAADGDLLSAVRITTLPATGTLELGGNPVTAGDEILVASIGTLTFTPAANANGAANASFTFQVRDDGGTTNGGVDLDQSANTITFDVTSVNDAPAGADNTIATLEGATHTFVAGDFGFTDPADGDSLSAVRITTLPATGTLELNSVAVTAGDEIAVADIGNLTFTPAADANGAANASFTFQVRDDGGTADGGVDLDQSANTITFDVTSVNDAPAGADNTITTLEDTAHTFVAGDFGFTDAADGDLLSAVRITTLPATGALELGGIPVTAGDEIAVADIGTLTFTPAANANGAANASFTFQVRDDGGTANGGVDLDQSANTITFDVTSVNDAPAGADNTITTLEDTAHTFVAGDFGFTDAADGNTLSAVRITTLPATGTLELNSVAVTAGDEIAVADIGTLTFTPAANANGAANASFTFQVRDDGGTADGGVDLDQSANTITFDVTSVNDADPVITSNGGGATAAISVAEGVTLVTDVQSIDADGDTENGGGITYSLTSTGVGPGVDNDRFAIGLNEGVLQFIPATDFEAPTDDDMDNFYDVQVTATDSDGGTDVQNLSIEVTDQPPLVLFSLSAPTTTVNEGDAPAITIGIADREPLGNGQTASVSLQIIGSGANPATAADFADFNTSLAAGAGVGGGYSWNVVGNTLTATGDGVATGGSFTFSLPITNDAEPFEMAEGFTVELGAFSSSVGVSVGIDGANDSIPFTINADAPPVIVDLDGDGLEFIALNESSAHFDIDGDGTAEQTAWISGDDGILAIDLNGDGAITDRSEIVMTDHAEEAETDLEAVRLAFDSDGDSLLTAADARWADFGIWQDANEDGISDDGEFQSLGDLGIVSLDLISNGIASTPVSGVNLSGMSTLTYADGSTAEVGDATLSYADLPAPDEVLTDGGVDVDAAVAAMNEAEGESAEGDAPAADASASATPESGDAPAPVSAVAITAADIAPVSGGADEGAVTDAPPAMVA